MYHRRQTVEIVKLFVALSAVKWFFPRCPVGSVHVHSFWQKLKITTTFHTRRRLLFTAHQSEWA